MSPMVATTGPDFNRHQESPPSISPLVLREIRQNFEMSRYMWRKYKQKRTKFILGAVYIHPNVPQEAIEYFMFQMLSAYSEAIRLIFPNVNPDTETPVLLCRDFNMDIMQTNHLRNL